jgi:hypothetical protein
LAGKQMEGDNRQRRKKAREAREEGQRPSETGGSLGASKQRTNVQDAEHREKIETIRQGKHKVIRENTPEPKPGYGATSDD